MRLIRRLSTRHEVKLLCRALKDPKLSFAQYYAGVITYLEYKADNGADIAVITGYNLLGLLTQHIVLPPNFGGAGTVDFDSVTGSAEKCIKYYWNNNDRN